MYLSKQLKQWRAERPDEWKMDEFIREAENMEQTMEQNKTFRNFCLEAIGCLLAEGTEFTTRAEVLKAIEEEMKDLYQYLQGLK